jgi:hypothetical protein
MGLVLQLSALPFMMRMKYTRALVERERPDADAQQCVVGER